MSVGVSVGVSVGGRPSGCPGNAGWCEDVLASREGKLDLIVQYK